MNHMNAREIAKERIERLFDLAEERLEQGRGDFADRYIELARRIGMRNEVSLDKDYRRRYCSNCGSFLSVGKNCKVRIDSKNSTVNYQCEGCGEIDRYGFKD